VRFAPVNDFPTKAVVTLAGARDYYQLPLALYESRLLQALVTDVYWPADRKWFSSSVGSLPKRLSCDRFSSPLGSEAVQLSANAMGAAALMKAMPNLNLNRYKDKALGKKARKIALKTQAALFCYSYYASEAFKPNGELPRYRFLFQLHPHPMAVRALLQEEVELVPHAKGSLMSEHELSLSANEFRELSNEPHLANGWVVASSYTARTLAEFGIPLGQINVVPYGVDSLRFSQRTNPPAATAPFTVMYVGSLIQRKGLSYLLDAARMLGSDSVHFVLCGRGHVDEQLLAHYSDVNVEVKIGLPTSQLVEEIRRSDVFVLPSLVEGFSHAILEAMSCGVPVVTTNHTCAPDVMTDKVHGFIVPIRNSEAIAESLEWGMGHRAELARMGQAGAARAQCFTWERFRIGVRQAYAKMLATAS